MAERKKNQTQLLLGQIKSHKEAVSSTILEWVKTVLKLADVDVNIFNRAAPT